MEEMPRFVTVLFLAVLSGLGVRDARAQEPAAPASTPRPAPTPAPRSSDFTLGLAWGGPLRLNGSATAIWGRPKMLVGWAPGKLAQVRVGARGAQLGLGVVAGVFEDSVVKPNGLAVTLKAVAIRTWRDPARGEGRTYAGFESDVILLGLRGSLGYARRVGGASGRDNRFVWSLGLGL